MDKRSLYKVVLVLLLCMLVLVPLAVMAQDAISANSDCYAASAQRLQR